jgi:peptidyl-prolyl cis-trans isomerase SurA
MKLTMKALLVLLAISSIAIAQEEIIVEEVLVKVNDEIISKSDFDSEFDQIKEQFRLQYKGDSFEADLLPFKKEIFNSMINKAILKQKAIKMGVRFTDDMFLSRIEQIKQQSEIKTEEELIQALSSQNMTLDDLKARYEIAYMENAIFSREIYQERVDSESKIQEFYELHQDKYSTEEKFHLAQIVIPVGVEGKDIARAEAELALSRIKAGEEFEAVYRSLTPGAESDSTGDIGELLAATIRQEMRDALKDKKTGDISEVVELESAFLILKVITNSPKERIPLEEIAQQVQADIRQEAIQEGIDDLILKYKRDSFIEVKSAEFVELYELNHTSRGQ